MKYLMIACLFAFTLPSKAQAHKEIVLIDQINHLDNLQSKIIECPQGTTLPFSLAFEGNVLSCDEEALGQIRLLSSCFISFEGENNPLFSEDLENWKSFNEFFCGKISLSLDEGVIQGIIKLQKEI